MIREVPVHTLLDVQYFSDVTGWTSVLANATGVQIQRGGNVNGVKIKTDVGTAVISLFNDQDPLDDADLTTGVPVRVVMRSDGTPMFTGKVLDVVSDAVLDKATGKELTYVTVTAVDAIHPLVNTRVEGTPMFYYEPGSNEAKRVQTLEERLARLATVSPVPIALPQAFEWETVYELPATSTADGWSLITPLPTAVMPNTSWIGRGAPVVNRDRWGNPLASPRSSRALTLNWRATGAVTLEKNVYGIQKTIQVEPGQVYRFGANVKGDYPPEIGTIGDFAVRGILLGVDGVKANTGAFITTNTGSDFPSTVAFKAQGTTATLQIWLSRKTRVDEAFQLLSRLQIFDVRVEKVDTVFPQLLAWSMKDTTLDAHLDLAASSVASYWYTDRTGVVRFAPPSEYLPVTNTFSDQRQPGVLEYTDAKVTQDTRDLVNYLTISNTTFGSSIDSHTIPSVRAALKKSQDVSSTPTSTKDKERWGSEETATYTWVDEVSIEKYGIRATTVETNLQLPDARTLDIYGLDEAVYGSVAYYDLLDKLTGQRQNPRLIVKELRWNVQQNTQKAKSLELGQRIVVQRRGMEQDAIIAGIKHDITPYRWMITLTLARP
ncbi:hypothetical protein LQ938_09585 [Microbacterium sp. cx-55]|uniref:hypothetical protein n=1 Tax=Microbacterium sp. cx-55 TaxID=2875948 RepID=UPI001CBD11E8|nr:hypothetical protein [Microbacterium sp. cx-55]MBZ4485986.1 hypothetical protein [Microbacterium sp. cx-55]UGB34140.1 hypothetical protein LQ938_09585 [Microbacterium sp. cx-55]